MTDAQDGKVVWITSTPSLREMFQHSVTVLHVNITSVNNLELQLLMPG